MPAPNVEWEYCLCGESEQGRVSAVPHARQRLLPRGGHRGATGRRLVPAHLPVLAHRELGAGEHRRHGTLAALLQPRRQLMHKNSAHHPHPRQLLPRTRLLRSRGACVWNASWCVVKLSLPQRRLAGVLNTALPTDLSISADNGSSVMLMPQR
jgi:hypothetical protein